MRRGTSGVAGAALILTLTAASEAFAQAPAPPPAAPPGPYAQPGGYPPPVYGPPGPYTQPGGYPPPVYGPPGPYTQPGGYPPPVYGPPGPYGYGQPPPPPEPPVKTRNVAITTNMLNLVVGGYGLEVGVRLADFVSLNANFLYWYWPFSHNDVTFTLTGGGIGFQFFPTSGHAFKGFYIYPALEYYKATDSDAGSANVLGLGATFGYQWLFDFGMILRVGGGFTRYSVASGQENSLEGVLPSADGHIGFAF